MLVLINYVGSDYCLLILQFHLVKHHGFNLQCVFQDVSSQNQFFLNVFENFFNFLKNVVYYF